MLLFFLLQIIKLENLSEKTIIFLIRKTAALRYRRSKLVILSVNALSESQATLFAGENRAKFIGSFWPPTYLLFFPPDVVLPWEYVSMLTVSKA